MPLTDLLLLDDTDMPARYEAPAEEPILVLGPDGLWVEARPEIVGPDGHNATLDVPLFDRPLDDADMRRGLLAASLYITGRPMLDLGFGALLCPPGTEPFITAPHVHHVEGLVDQIVVPDEYLFGYRLVRGDRQGAFLFPRRLQRVDTYLAVREIEGHVEWPSYVNSGDLEEAQREYAAIRRRMMDALNARIPS